MNNYCEFLIEWSLHYPLMMIEEKTEYSTMKRKESLEQSKM